MQPFPMHITVSEGSLITSLSSRVYLTGQKWVISQKSILPDNKGYKKKKKHMQEKVKKTKHNSENQTLFKWNSDWVSD